MGCMHERSVCTVVRKSRLSPGTVLVASTNKRSLTTHLLCACFEMEEDHTVAARIRYQVLLDEVHIALHVRLESKQVPMA